MLNLDNARDAVEVVSQIKSLDLVNAEADAANVVVAQPGWATATVTFTVKPKAAPGNSP